MKVAALYAGVEAIDSGLLCLPWAEFGVWTGNSAAFLLRMLGDNILHLYDSFEGIPEVWTDYVPRFLGDGAPKGMLSLEGQVPPFLTKDPRVILHKGWFEKTIRPGHMFAFVHVDCDLYSSAKTILERISLHPGLVLVFDEFPEGEQRALDETGVRYRRLYETQGGQVVVRILAP